MAHYRGTVQGGGRETSRLGHKSSGICAGIASWEARFVAQLFWHAESEQDWAVVCCGDYTLYHGPYAALHDAKAAQTFLVNYVKAFHKQLADMS